jgi:hypothetical protein
MTSSSITAENRLPLSVKVCNVKCERRPVLGTDGSQWYEYGGSIGSWKMLCIRQSPMGRWHGQFVAFRNRGTRGECVVSTCGVYSCPRRCAEALNRLVWAWHAEGLVSGTRSKVRSRK